MDITPRALSHDERHAADAAFAGRPFNPRWSARAKAIYDGILKSLPTPPQTTEAPAEEEHAATGPLAAQAPEGSQPDTIRGTPTPIPFEQALAAGSLIDVSSTAKELGLSFSVTVTKPLWETGIAAGRTEEERSARLRDVLMAFRLRLTAQPTMAPLIDFPALLAFPHGAIPQPVPLFALIQPDEQHKTMATLLLPTEIATTIIPMN
ncbi:MAG TPA: hypothetical protein VL261_11770 [Nitrospira sp.]|jgi:hypothetical protein|nr:hypothetical protein [Nitrospira sp.]